MRHMLVNLTYSAAAVLTSVSSHSSYDGQCTVKTLLAFIANLVDDCEQSMLVRHLLTPAQLMERAWEDFELGLYNLEQQARQELDALSSPPQHVELHT